MKMLPFEFWNLMKVYLIISLLCYIYNSAFRRKNDYKNIIVLSADFDWDTINRVKKGIRLQKQNKSAPIIICGKYKSDLMKNEFTKNKIKNYVIQNESTNTYEDAVYLNKLISIDKLFPIALVTSQPHMRRSLHTFQRVFPHKKIYAYPTNDIFNLYSPFLPSGWFGSLLNIYKDFKYNAKIF